MSNQRWKDSLDDSLGPIAVGDPEQHMRKAIKWLGVAVEDGPGNDGYRRLHLAYAGAYIRAARKGLQGKSQRVGDFHSEDAALLTSALRDVTEALDAHRFADGAEAHSLRCAEAALRTMWKRGQS